MTIEGWLLTRSGVADFQVYLDDQLLGEAHCGLVRQDVGGAFPDWPNAVRSGFAFHCPPRSLREGDHTVRLAIRASNGIEMSRSFQIVVKKIDDRDDAVAIRRRMPRVETDMMLAVLAGMNPRPDFPCIIRQGSVVNPDAWRTTLEALRRQAYREWTVTVLVSDDATAAAVQALVIAQVPGLADRFAIISPTAAAWNAPLAQAPSVQHGGGSLVALLSPGDEPGVDALLELALAKCRNPGSDLFYGDEMRISPVSQEKEAFLKPDYAPDLLAATNYIGRIWVAGAALLARTGVTPASLAVAGSRKQYS